MPDVLTDERVTHLWDEKRTVGRWFAENFELEGCNNEISWDAFYVFGPETEWTDRPGPLVASGFTIWGRRENLREAIVPLLAR